MIWAGLGYLCGLVPPWVKWAGLALLVALAYTGGRVQQHRLDKAATLAERLEASQEARRIEQARAARIQEAQSAKDAELRRVGAALAAALGELRNRPKRLPEPGRVACAGSTGAELSAEDAAFLVGEAARADALRAELGACYGER